MCKLFTKNLTLRVVKACHLAAVPVLAICLAAGAALAQQANPSEAGPPEKVREIFVPFKDLNILLENQPRRVLLSRQQYNELLKKAKLTPARLVPQAAVLTAADYSGESDGQRVRFTGTLAIDVLEEGLQSLPLDLGGVGLLAAKLDQRDAPIGRAPSGGLSLLVEGVGRHALLLEMVAPLETTAAQQMLSFRLPRAAAGRLRLTVPGDVEIRSGADVAGRVVDHAAAVTRFELLPTAGDATLLMSLNSHLKRKEQAVLARSVLVDEVTAGCEKLYATVSLAVLYRAVDHFRFVVPEGFEITEINSPLLSRWDVKVENGRKIANVRLREQTTETVVLNIAAVRAAAPLGEWRFPQWEPLDVEGHVAVLGLLAQQPWKVESLQPQRLIPIDTTVLAAALPLGAAESGDDGLPLRGVAAYYAPQGDFSLSGRFVKPAAELAVTANVLLVVENGGLHAYGGWAMLPDVEKRFSFDFTLPAGWQLVSLAAADQQPLSFECYGPPAEARRVHVRLPQGIPPGQEYRAYFHALRTPPGWLADWKTQNVEFPAFPILGAAHDEGALVVAARDDLTVRPEKIQRLVPLDANEMGKYGLSGVTPSLAYRYEHPSYAAALVVERTLPRLTARTCSCFRVSRDEGLVVRDELVYHVEEARARRLALELPRDTPADLKIYGLGGTRLKEFLPEPGKPDDAMRRWNVFLEEPSGGEVRLGVEFKQPLAWKEGKEIKDCPLPVIRAADVAYQSGLVSVEGSAELDVQVDTAARRVDVGELAATECQPGRYLRGVFGFVGAPPAVKIGVSPHQGYPLYSAIAQQAQFTTLLSADGASQTQARFMLRTKALYLEVKLPEGAELWSAQLLGPRGGAPLKPQREGKSLLVGLPAGAAGGVYFLQLIYAAPVEAASAGGRGTLRVPALHLLLRAERQAQAVDLPLADLEWTVRLPGGYEATWAGGTLATEGVPKPHPAALDVAGAIYCLAGGVNPFYGVSQARENARRIPCANDQRETSAAVQSYESTQGKYLGWGAAAEPVPPCPPEPAEKPAVSVGAANAPCVKAPCCCAKAPYMPQGATSTFDDRGNVSALTLAPRDGTATFSGVIQNGSGTVDLTKNDNGYLGYAGTATYTAPVGGVSTPHVMASNLNVGDSRKGGFTQSGGTKAFSDYHAPGVNAGAPYSAPPATSPYAGLLNNGGAVSQYNSTAAPPQSPPPVSLTGSGTVQMGNNSGVTDNGLLSFDLSSGTTTMATITRNGNNPNAPVRGSGGVAKTDSGMLILTGKDAYTGGDGKRLEAALKSPTQMEFNDAPLSDVIDYLQNYHHVEIQLDKRVLGEAGIATDTPVTKSLKGISLQSALRAMLRDLGLTYVVQNGIVLITTPAEADKRAEAGASFTADLDIPFTQGAYGKGRATRGGMEGGSSLKIQLQDVAQAAGRTLTFRSLGAEPVLLITMAERSRLDALGWGLALAVGLIGLVLTNRSLRTKVAFIFAVALVATLLPLAADGLEVALTCNMVFYAVSLLVPYYLLAGLVKWLIPGCCCGCRSARMPAAAGLLVLLAALAALAGNASAQTPGEENGRDPGPPVVVPDDAIIRPYDPGINDAGIYGADRLLVPYGHYVELWNRAHPDKKLEAHPAPLPYALAGAAYRTTLVGDENLLLSGKLAIDVFADDYVQVPLGLRGGVLCRAELDGKPARLEMPLETMATLYVRGKGRHTLELEVRVRLTRQGGWRVAEAALPTCPASTLAVQVPSAQTELRLSQVPDRRSYDTDRDGQTIQTVLGPGGEVALQWRPKVAEGQVDRSLTAQSTAVVDVEEDGVRAVWDVGLEFRRNQREQFQFSVPKGYLVEKVTGSNVRGWELRKAAQAGEEQTVEISLLKPAKDREQVAIALWRSGAVGQKELAEFDVPLVQPVGAVQASGQLTIRRSPLLDVQTVAERGVTRIDLSDAAGPQSEGQSGDQSPLGIRPYQAYRFATMPFSLRLLARPLAAKTTADVQAVVKFTEYGPTLEARAIVHVQDRPIYRVEVILPDDLKVRQVTAPGDYQYALTQRDGHPLATIYFATAQQGDVPVLVRGALGGGEKVSALALPSIEVCGVEAQAGDIAVQVDPAFDVDHGALQDCQETELQQLAGWLTPQQRQLTRLAVRYVRPGYRGSLKLVPRKADVVCDTISHVRVTDRAIEETIVLTFTVQRAGVRELRFQLPASMADARVMVPMLRRKIVAPIGDKPDAPLRFRIELQDEMMGQICVRVLNDRLRPEGPYSVPIPVVETGRTNRQYVTLQNAGRDEVKPTIVAEMDPISPRQEEWQKLRGELRSEITQAYAVAADATRPQVFFQIVPHRDVEVVGARISLAETMLILDEHGAYRAAAAFHMNNATEQFLEVELPAGAALWTAVVDNQPVKPIEDPKAAKGRRVLIPLVKTAAGDLDYIVTLKYGGQTAALGNFSAVNFPLVHAKNINAERSVVQLHLPAAYQWLDFGGTMHPGEEGDVTAAVLSYQTKQAQRLMETVRGKDPFAQQRAMNNLKALDASVMQYRQQVGNLIAGNRSAQAEAVVNSQTLAFAEKSVAEGENTLRAAQARGEGTDYWRRYRVADLVVPQKAARARNVLNEAGANWENAPTVAPPAGPAPQQAGQFNGAWLGANKLAANAPDQKTQPSGATWQNAVPQGGFVYRQGGYGGGKGGFTQQPAMPGFQQEGGRVTRNESLEGAREKNEESLLVERYQQRLQQQQGVVVNGNPAGVNSYGLTLNGPGTQVLSGANTYSGLTTITAGTLQIGSTYSGGTTVAGGTVQLDGNNRYTGATTVANGAILDLSGYSPTIGSLSGSGTVGPLSSGAVTLGGGTLQEGGEGQTGRVQVGVGVNSEAGVVGNPIVTGGSGSLGTVAEILGGSGGEAGRTVGMTWRGGAPGGAPVPQAATGLASLDVQLPQRGAIFYFIAPRGDVELTAQAVRGSFVETLSYLAGVVVVAIVIGLLVRAARRLGFAWLAGPRANIVMVCLGAVAVVCGILPIAGLVLLLVGLVLLIRRMLLRRGPPALPGAALAK